MGRSKNFFGFTIPEMMITIAIMTMLMYFAWSFYFQGRELTRHGVSQSQMQNETRIFFDHLTREIAAAYRFIDIDGENPESRKFSFYSFTYARTGLDRINFDEATGESVPTQDQKFKVLKILYEWTKGTGTVTKTQTPGYLYFLRKPVMEFSPGPNAEFENSPDAPYVKEVLHNIADFEVKGYELNYNKTTYPPFTMREITGTGPNNATMSTFIVLRIHNKIDEAGQRRDEELDLVGKFYSKVRLMDTEYPGYFSTIDEQEGF